MASDSAVERMPKVGEVWRLAATKDHPPIQATITKIWEGRTVYYESTDHHGAIWWPVFRASARFLRER
jgi:hypothetical protein